MGLWPFAWTWKTKGGGRVWVGGFVLMPLVLSATWLLSNPYPRRGLPSASPPPRPRPPEQHRQLVEGQMNTNFMLIPIATDDDWDPSKERSKT